MEPTRSCDSQGWFGRGQSGWNPIPQQGFQFVPALFEAVLRPFQEDQFFRLLGHVVDSHGAAKRETGVGRPVGQQNRPG